MFTCITCGEGQYCKTANAFGVSRPSVSSIIRRVLQVVTTFIGPQLIKLPKSEMEVNELYKKFSESHGFPQCIRVINDTHIEIKEPNEHYSDYINRKGYYSIKRTSRL